MKSNRWLFAIALSVLLVTMLVACAAPTPQVVQQTVVVPQTVVAQQTVVVSQTVVAQQTVVVPQTVAVPQTVVVSASQPPIKQGGTLTIAIGGDIDNFDPHVSGLIMFELIRRNVYGALAVYDENMKLVPDQAESWEMVDASTYVVHIRKGVKFHNGREMTAQDVQYSFTRAKDQAPRVAKIANTVASMEILDNYTIRFKLQAPNVYFMNDTYLVTIVPKEAADNLKTTPIGAGPFKFVKWIPNDRIILQRFEDYWNKGSVNLDQIVLRVMPNVQAAIANLESGEVDAVREVSVSDALRFLTSEDIKVVKPTSSNSAEFWVFGNKNKALQNPRVRQALAYALDKDAIENTVWFGQGTLSWSYLPPSSTYYKKLDGYPYDPEKCKQILAQEGYPGLEFTVETISGIPRSMQETVIWQAGVAKCGAKMNIVDSELSVWLQKYMTSAFDVSWNSAGYSGNPAEWISVTAGVLVRNGVWNNQDAAKLFDQGTAEGDPAKAAVIFNKLQDILIQDLPQLTVGTAPTISLVRSYVKGWRMNAKQDFLIREVWLDKP